MPQRPVSPPNSDELHRLRQRALLARRDTLQEVIEAHRGSLRDLYHVLQTRTTMTLAPSASARAGDDPAELTNFLNKHSLSNPNFVPINEFELAADATTDEMDIDILELFETIAAPPGSSSSGLADSFPSHAVPKPPTPLRRRNRSAESESSAEKTFNSPRLVIQDQPLTSQATQPSEAAALTEEDDMLIDVKEESPAPPILTISPHLSMFPTVNFPSEQATIPSSLLPQGDTPIPELTDTTISFPEEIPPLISHYSASLYPLPPAEIPKKRKKEAKRYTTSGTAVVDLTKWEATMIINPASRIAKKAGKCLTTSEWQVMFNEIRYLKTMQRINELKAKGIWSFRQPKKQKGPTLNKSHQDYLLEEMKWMQTDFREERKWKLVVAMELAYAALEWYQADNERRKELTANWRRPISDDDELDADRVKDEVMDVEMTEGDRDPEPGPSHFVTTDLLEDQIPPSMTRHTRTAIGLLRTEREEDDDEDDEDEEDDAATAQAVQKQAALDAEQAVKEVIQDFDEQAKQELQEQDQALVKEEDVKGSRPALTTPRSGSDADGDGEPDEEMDPEGAEDADGDADAEEPEQLGIPDLRTGDGSQNAPAPQNASMNDASSSSKVGLKSNGRDTALSSTATSLLDPKTLRLPLLNLDFETTVFNLSDLLEQSLSVEEKFPLPDQLDINLPQLFPDLGMYSFSDPPSIDSNDKKDKRVDESGMSSGRLTMTSRLLDAKHILVSSLQPGRKYRKGAWEDLSDLPVTEEPRDYSEARSDSIPPAAPMFSGVKARDHIHPTQFQAPPDPSEKESRLQHFAWTTEEDQLLKSLYNQFGLNWSLIADVFNSARVIISTDVRSPWDCFQRWATICDKNEEIPSGRVGTPSDLIQSPVGPTPLTRRESLASRATVKKQQPAPSKVAGKRAIRHALLYDAVRKTIKKRDAKPAIKPRANPTLHDTHQAVAQQKHHTPAELSRLKHERDQQIMQQQILYERRRQQQELTRQTNRPPGLPVPNIAQQPRLGMTPLGAMPGVGVPRVGSMTPVQQQAALLQAQRNAQQIAQQQQAQQQQQQQQQNAQLNGGTPMHTNGQMPGQMGHPGPSASPAPAMGSPHPSATAPNGRPPSAMNGSPQTPNQMSAAQVAYNARGSLGNASMAQSLQAIGAEGLKNHPHLQQMLWQQRLNQQQQQQSGAPSGSTPAPSSSPHPPPAGPSTQS